MIRVNSFIPMSNFTRATYDFLDDKIVIKDKSLFTEYNTETKYEEIKHIQIEIATDLRWIWLGLAVTLIPAFLSGFFLVLGLTYQNNPTFPIIAKVIVVFGFILCTPIFQRNRYYVFLDRARKNLMTIKEDINNYEAINQAVDLVRQKSTIISDTNPEKPLPNVSPVFEHIDFDFKDYLNKSVTRFYEDKLIFTKKSLVEEIVREVNYSELSGKFIYYKSGGDWISIWLNLVLFFGSMAYTLSLFFPQFWCAWLPRQIFLIFFISSLLISMMFFFKGETLLFLGPNDNLIYGMRSNSKNRKKLEAIVEYVKSKIILSDQQQT